MERLLVMNEMNPQKTNRFAHYVTHLKWFKLHSDIFTTKFQQ